MLGGILLKFKFLGIIVFIILAVMYMVGREEVHNLTIAGSTSVQPIAEILSEEFEKQHSGVRINVQGGGSSAGVKSTQSGTADIGMSSRELKSDERGLFETIIALDGIGIIVNTANPITELTMEEVRKIFTGEIRNWKEIGGIDAPITVVNREAGSGTRGAFEEIIMGPYDFLDKIIIQGSTGAVRQTVAGDINAVGYISLVALESRVKALNIEGVVPNPETIKAGDYKMSRPFILLTKKEPEGLIKEFIDFALSQEGQRICKEEGLITVR
jgi:phosphate transport system substrate-binding protein